MSGHPWGGPGQVGGPSRKYGMDWGPSGRSETGRGTLWEVRDGLVDPQGGLGRVGGPTGRSGTGRETLEAGWDGSEDTLGSSGWVGGPLERSKIGRGTIPEVRDGSGDPQKIQDGLGDTSGGLEQVKGP